MRLGEGYGLLSRFSRAVTGLVVIVYSNVTAQAPAIVQEYLTNALLEYTRGRFGNVPVC